MVSAEIRKDADKWTLVLAREFRHAPAAVWQALTDPAQLREWAPFDADRNLGSPGQATLSTAGVSHVTQTNVTRAEAPRVLEFSWGGQDIRWQLEPLAGGGTRLTLWHNIDRRFIAMGAAGWHVCLDVLDRALDGTSAGRVVGPDAMKNPEWQQRYAEYARQFGVEAQ